MYIKNYTRSNQIQKSQIVLINSLYKIYEFKVEIVR